MPPGTDPFGKTVLLIDSNQNLAEARARRLRLYGITVHTAASIEEARISLGKHNYHLVLLATRESPEEAIRLQKEIKRLHPEQRVGFFVGPPKYISFTFGRSLVPMPARSGTWVEKLKGHLASA